VCEDDIEIKVRDALTYAPYLL